MSNENDQDKEKLLGDIVENALKKAGAKKLARATQRVTGKPCGCGKRKQRLNNLHKNLKNKINKND